jgi:hypothetical protein
LNDLENTYQSFELGNGWLKFSSTGTVGIGSQNSLGLPDALNVTADNNVSVLGIYRNNITTSQEVGDALSQRVLAGWKMDSFTCKSSLVSANHEESALEILNRLDNQELRGVS